MEARSLITLDFIVEVQSGELVLMLLLNPGYLTTQLVCDADMKAWQSHLLNLNIR